MLVKTFPHYRRTHSKTSVCHPLCFPCNSPRFTASQCVDTHFTSPK